MTTNTPFVLIIRDGWGRNPHPEHDEWNAIHLARTPRCDALLEEYPWTLIKTSGEDVGLPDGTMGNSEVGHQNLGAGRIVDQESVRITKAIREGTFFRNEVLVAAVDGARDRGRAVHLFGIASEAGVHGLLSHLYACLELCRRREAAKVFVHLFTDGRDTGPFTGRDFVRQAEAKCAEIGAGEIATVCGRYYAMDRDNRWQRVRRAYDALTGRGEPPPHFDSAAAAVEAYYDRPTNSSQEGDEFVTPRTVGADPGVCLEAIKELDCVAIIQGNHDVYAADEAFVTGTFGALTPVIEVDGRPIGGAPPGPVTAQLADAYRDVLDDATYSP